MGENDVQNWWRWSECKRDLQNGWFYDLHELRLNSAGCISADGKLWWGYSGRIFRQPRKPKTRLKDSRHHCKRYILWYILWNCKLRSRFAHSNLHMSTIKLRICKRLRDQSQSRSCLLREPIHSTQHSNKTTASYAHVGECKFLSRSYEGISFTANQLTKLIGGCFTGFGNSPKNLNESFLKSRLKHTL